MALQEGLAPVPPPVSPPVPPATSTTRLLDRGRMVECENLQPAPATKCILMKIPNLFRRTGRARLRFSWYKYKTQDVYNCFFCFSRHCFKM